MAKVLTEADAFTATITVPEGTDSRNNAADVVEAIAQALANRTKNLNLHAAKIDAANVFTQAQQINQVEPDTPIISTSKKPTDYAPLPTNKWQLLFTVPNDATRDTRFYVGSDNTSGLFAVTVNARWHVPTQLWRQLDTGAFSYALILTGGGLRWSRQAAGASPWASWPLGAGTMEVGGGLSAGAGINATLINAATDFVLNYPGGVARTNVLPIAAVGGGGLRNGYDGGVGTGWLTLTVSIPVRLPPNGEFPNGALQVMVQQEGPAPFPCTVELVKLTTSWNPPLACTREVVGTKSPPNIPGLHVVAFDIGAFDPTAEYQIEFTPKHPYDTIRAMRLVNWLDKGPRNF